MATKASTPTTAPATATKPKAKPAATAATPSGAAPAPALFIRRKEFVARVVATSGLKPNAVKTALDAILQEMGDALSNGEALQLPPLGKLSVKRQKDLRNGEMMVCKLRRTTPPEKTEATLANEPE